MVSLGIFGSEALQMKNLQIATSRKKIKCEKYIERAFCLSAPSSFTNFERHEAFTVNVLSIPAAIDLLQLQIQRLFGGFKFASV